MLRARDCPYSGVMLPRFRSVRAARPTTTRVSYKVSKAQTTKGKPEGALGKSKVDRSLHWDEDEEIPEYAFASRNSSKEAPTDKLPTKSFHPREAYQIVKDMRQLDHNPRLNLATFVTTWMEDEADKVMLDALSVNHVEAQEYPSCKEIEDRCIRMLADLFHAPDPHNSPGAGCIGSSEAIMLGALSMKKHWQERREKEGKDFSKPNIVMGHNTHVCWEKFCRYFDVECRFVNLAPGHYHISPEGARELIDKNTIGMAAILGSTYTGAYDDVKALDALSEEMREKHGWVVPIHVDAASGGFVAPFIAPDLEWDFRLKNVVSINASGHKYGLVYAGIGWLVFRDREALHDSLIFTTNYLGSEQPNITLNFSRGAANIVAQYYQFLRLGWEGYHTVMDNLMKVASFLRHGINQMEAFEVVSDDNTIPLVAFSVTPIKGESGEKKRAWDEFELEHKLMERGWIIPAYAMPPDVQDMTVMRVVVREDLTLSMVESLLKDLEWAVDWLDAHFRYPDDEAGNERRKHKHKIRAASVVRGRT